MSALIDRLYPSPDLTHPHTELLLLCSRRILNAKQQQRLLELANLPIDWEQFFHLSVDHKVYPLVYKTLEKHLPNTVPPALMGRWKQLFFRNLKHNLFVQQEITRLMRDFDTQQIRVLLIKGPVVAHLLYRDISLREFKDIDLVVHRDEFEAAKVILMAVGYQQIESDARDADYHLTFINAENSVEIELHWAVSISFMPFMLDQQNYWDQLVDFSLNNLKLYSLPPEEMLFMLCIHGAKHRWHRLKWLCDIHEFINTYSDLDWVRVIERAEALRIRRVVVLNLYLASALFGRTLPPNVERWVQSDALVKPLGNYIQRWIFQQSDEGWLAQIRSIGYFLFVRELFADRIPYIIHTVRHDRSPQTQRLLIASVVILFLICGMLSLAMRFIS